MKMFVVILGAAALLAAAYYGLQGNRLPGVAPGDPPSAPKQTLDNVRQKARSIEQDAQRRADEMLEKSR